MSIVLRVNKGSALTYNEMDRNQSQFFYSSSLDTTGTKLRLFYTGSSALNESGIDFAPDRYQEVPFPVAPDITIPEAAAAGSNTQIQFNDNGLFGADTLFTFNKDKNAMGIGGDPDSGYKITVTAEQSRPANILLKGLSAVESAEKAILNFGEDSNIIGAIGRTSINDQHIYLGHTHKLNERTFGKVNISISDDEELTGPAVVGTFTKLSNGDKVFGIGTENPNRNISVAGTHGLGVSVQGIADNESFLKPLYGDILSTTDENGSFFVPPSSNPSGLLISSPGGIEGGNVVLNINTDSSKLEAFNIVSTVQSSFDQATADSKISKILGSFGADGKHGINTQNANLTGLTVEGNVSSSGFVSIGTIPEEENAGDVTVIGVDTVGKIHKSKAAPVPIGGIIMWSGAVQTLPAGFVLCDGTNGTPNLQDKFIVGASNTTGTPTSTVSGSAASTGGNANHDHGGNTQNHTLTSSEIPSHTHPYKDTLFTEEFGSFGGTAHVDEIEELTSSSSNRNSSTDGNGSGVNAYLKNRTTSATGGGSSHSHGITQASSIPPYYALAFIMYKG